jgi:hypothetical protein
MLLLSVDATQVIRKPEKMDDLNVRGMFYLFWHYRFSMKGQHIVILGTLFFLKKKTTKKPSKRKNKKKLNYWPSGWNISLLLFLIKSVCIKASFFFFKKKGFDIWVVQYDMLFEKRTENFLDLAFISDDIHLAVFFLFSFFCCRVVASV